MEQSVYILHLRNQKSPIWDHEIHMQWILWVASAPEQAAEIIWQRGVTCRTLNEHVLPQILLEEIEYPPVYMVTSMAYSNGLIGELYSLSWRPGQL